MEWVIALLAVGCLFFLFQIAFAFVKHKAIVDTRLKNLEESREDLQLRIEEAKKELEVSRGALEPAKKDVEALEQEYQALQDEIDAEREKTRKNSANNGENGLN